MEKYLVNVTPAAPLSLAVSERTALVDSHMGHPRKSLFFANQYGLYQAFSELHHQPDAIHVENCAPERLKSIRVLVLADARALTEDQEQTIRQWVRQGGCLIAMGDTSACDEWGRARDRFGLSDVFGVRRTGADKRGASFSLPGLGLKQAVTYSRKLPRTKVRLAGATSLGVWNDGEIACTKNAYGKGTAYLLTAARIGLCFDGSVEYALKLGLKNRDMTLDRAYWDGVKPILDALVKDGYAASGFRPVVEAVDVPDYVEITPRRQDNRVIVHLLNWSKKTPVKDIRLRVNLPKATKAFYPKDGAPASITVKGDGHLEITVRDLNAHEMLVVE